MGSETQKPLEAIKWLFFFSRLLLSIRPSSDPVKLDLA
jgi:hypothetical protein